eukprot:1154751-Pelagomonas_calceolata.AAC.5
METLGMWKAWLGLKNIGSSPRSWLVSEKKKGKEGRNITDESRRSGWGRARWGGFCGHSQEIQAKTEVKGAWHDNARTRQMSM